MKHEKLQAQIVSRVEYAMTFLANILRSSIPQRNRKILKKIVRIWTVTIPIARGGVKTHLKVLSVLRNFRHPPAPTPPADRRVLIECKTAPP
jgi:hypothetical protein